MTLSYYTLVCGLLFFISMLFFVERRSPYCQAVYKTTQENNQEISSVNFRQYFGEIIESSKGAQKSLAHLLHIFFVTFLVFPGITNFTTLTFIEGNGPMFQLFFVALFSVADTVGRFQGGSSTISKQTAYKVIHLRLIVALFIMVYAFQLKSQMENKVGDAIKIASILTLGWTNGFFATLCSCWAPLEVLPEDQEKVGVMSSIVLNIGIFTGSCV